jgi:hypothetical protein
MEIALGEESQVLNFGVSGYGINQMYLRYIKDVRQWNPEVVIIGVTSEMLWRMMSVYEFLIYPQHVDVPFSRPRLIIKDGKLERLNEPVLAPEEIFAHRQLLELPYLSFDRFFSTSDWEKRGGWRIAEASYLFRFLNSVRRPFPTQLGEDVSDATMAQLSRLLIRELVENVRRGGGKPVVVHFPYQWELRQSAERGQAYVPLGAKLLQNAGVEFYDATSCLLKADRLEGFERGGHYSPRTNMVLAGCIQELVNDLVRSESK